MVSPTEGWAFGPDDTVEHYINGSWQPYTINVGPPNSFDWTGVSMVSPSEGWAVGYTISSARGWIYHYQGGSWQQEYNTNTNEALMSIDMISSSEGWAVGGQTILHYLNGTWQSVADPVSGNPVATQLRSVSFDSSNDGWAVGYGGTILNYTNGSWGVVPSPSTDNLMWVAAPSSDSIWAVGWGDQDAYMTDSPIILTTSSINPPLPTATPSPTATASLTPWPSNVFLPMVHQAPRPGG